MRRLLTILLTFVCCSTFAQQDSLPLYPSTPLPPDSLLPYSSTPLLPDTLQSFSDSVSPQGVTAQRSFSDSVSPQGASAAGVQRLKDGTRVYPDTAIYQGMNIHLDLFTPILELARSKGKVQSYEIGMSWRLKQRLYPTFELGYAKAELEAEGARHKGQGAFFRAGIDLNGLKKRPERLNALLVGVRLGTAVQDYQLTNVQVVSPYWDGGVPYRFDMPRKVGADCWGEVVLGCQVQVWEGFQMGWNFRLKILMTRKAKNGGGLPAYIPGFGYRDDTNWGINYYIGYHF